MPAYLEELTVRLAAGAGLLPDDVRSSHIDYFLSLQQPDGGFAGREGGSDLYYTGFGLRALAILGELYGETAERCAAFLRGKLTGRESVIDLLSLIYGAALVEAAGGIDVFADLQHDWRTSISDFLETLRREDGGYAKGNEGSVSSTYHTFLVLLCRELIERPTPNPEAIVDFIRQRRRPDGGFLEIRVGKRAGANPTAAAIGVLRMLDRIDEDIREDTLDFLCDMQTDEGGFRANSRIPFADLLSTFTVIATLHDLGGLDEVELPEVAKYVDAMALPNGGFRAAALDESHDVEYGFYGIGARALLTLAQTPDEEE
ncbi:prenyltransferase/squalene oxidase repeat-containing protein [Lignipirellula cremea]|uniref:Geranylgeranyl transferase type II subunit beta n=1 Tax=Lignipirellula cremea TaxID=2528010 RepID=A0A518DSN7_9BACT|nr:prenyltransferase/squalene oxidase repeat-containing protein [Lignipirellula cremea]QDU94861.1 Prenyltransferase and squalene oxidase repeat protein [Lignipirellula cremea]